MVQSISDVPNVAIWGSFFHFPKETGGLIQATLVWSSRSPMDRSATWNQNKVTPHVLGEHRTEPRRFSPTYLFLVPALLRDEQIEHRSELLVDLLHLVDVAGNFVHGFHGNCRQAGNDMIRNQSGPVFQSLEKLHLKLHHFQQVPKQYIQLGEKSI
ncbi:hypothetical protein EYF80_014674 [Liparis tanakae]|uniref:Uncharacterized protein n=1 Tax=Liparis tanakae TaxID=230148 RepID=A0A4Z2IBL1_9TELE|nr:hypothetical protein EYF80_014674 [Liparis tanakae]